MPTPPAARRGRRASAVCFDLGKPPQEHGARRNCRDENGTEHWACGNCDCTALLEARMQSWGAPFSLNLANQPAAPAAGG